MRKSPIWKMSAAEKVRSGKSPIRKKSAPEKVRSGKVWSVKSSLQKRSDPKKSNAEKVRSGKCRSGKTPIPYTRICTCICMHMYTCICTSICTPADKNLFHNLFHNVFQNLFRCLKRFLKIAHNRSQQPIVGTPLWRCFLSSTFPTFLRSIKWERTTIPVQVAKTKKKQNQCASRPGTIHFLFTFNGRGLFFHSRTSEEHVFGEISTIQLRLI